ncbi:MAG: T9SS type A sorting domain-containing protein [Candidatus Electryonea clarkiae]|nr:T9SS type A sorting domain-containing protein [Candidatus Electryonea clarkiae]MDP8285401.1 T9SS type A sorting domain-containing protein [Candidatus Electryonea clarkiae]
MPLSYINKLFSPLFALILFIISNLFSPLYAQIWTNNGPPGGCVNSLEVAAWDDEIYFAGTCNTGMWRYSVEDSCWEECNSGMPWLTLFPEPYEIEGIYPEVLDILTHPLIEDKIWIALKHHGVWISENGGNSWYQTEESDITFYDLHVHASHPDTLFGAPGVWEDTLFQSHDGGETWNTVPGVPTGAITSVPVNPDHIFAGQKESFNGGRTWSDMGQYPGNLNQRTVELEIDPVDQATLWAITAPLTSGSNANLLKSSNQGRTWERNRGLPYSDIYSLKISRSRSVLVTRRYSNVTLIRSDDRGETWQDYNWTGRPDSINFKGWLRDIEILDPDASNILFAAGTSIYHSADGGESVEPFETGFVAALTRNLAHIAGPPETVFVGTSSGVFTSSNHGVTWEKLNDWVCLDIALINSDPITIFLATFPYNGNIFRSTDGGETWENIFYFDGAGFQSSTLVTNQIFPDTILFSTDIDDSINVYRSINGGDNWNQVFSEYNPRNRALGRLRYNPQNPEEIYVCGTNLYRSADAGTNWRAISTPGDVVYDVIVGFNDPGTLVIEGYNGIYLSTDYGETWENFSSGLTNLFASNGKLELLDPETGKIAYQQGRSSTIYSLSRGVFIRSLDDEQWELTNYSDNQGQTRNIHALENGELAVATSNRGVFISSYLTDLDEGNYRLVQPVGFSVEEPYPNPFNSSTKLEFNIIDAGLVRFSLYNHLGKLVLSKKSIYQVPGIYSFSIIGGEHASGVYFLSINTNSGSDTKRLVYLK